MKRRPTLLTRLRRERLRGLEVDQTVISHGDPVTAGYILFWAHIFWGLGVALSGETATHLYGNLPLVQLHLWDGLALAAALVLRVGLGMADMRIVQVGATLSFFLWAWVNVAFLIELGPSSALVYTAIATTAAWVVVLTRDAWARHARR